MNDKINKNDNDDVTSQPVDTDNDDTESQDKKVDKNIPYDRFKQVNEEKKALKAKIEAYEVAEKERNEAKLLEEKKYEELLKAKEQEIESHKTKMQELQKATLLEKINGKLISVASAEGAIDSEDIIRFIDVNTLMELEPEKLTEQIKLKISELKNNKAHLFSTLKRDSKENGMPYSVNASNISKKPLTRDQQIEEALRKSHRG